MFDMKKITESLYICDDVGLAIVNPVDTTHWVVIDKGSKTEYSKIVFGLASFEQCRVFVESVFLGEISV